MEKFIVSTGKTIELAIEAALQKLKLDRDSVSVEVLKNARSGFLGIGASPAEVKVTYEVPDEPVAPAAPRTALSSASRSAKPKERPDLTPSVISRPGKKPVEQPKKSAEGRKDAPAKKADRPEKKNNERPAKPQRQNAPKEPKEPREPKQTQPV